MSNFGDLNHPIFSASGRTSSNNPDPRGLSKPRFSKVRRQVKPMKPSSDSSLPGTHGFNPFLHRGSPDQTRSSINQGLVFGSSSGDRVVEDLGKLNIQVEDGRFASRLPGDMQNLNIEDNASSRHVDGDDDELQSLLKNKLNLDPAGHVIHEGLEKLNISGKVMNNNNNNVKSKDSLDYVGEKILSDDLSRKLNVGHDASARNMSEESLQGSGSVNEEKVRDFSSSCPMNFSFVGADATTSTVNTPEFSFSSNGKSGGTSFMEFKTPNLKPNPFSTLDQKLGFNAKKDSVGVATRGRRKGVKQPVKVQLNVGHEFAFSDSAFPQGATSEVSDSFSPMDVSPYEETADSRDFSAGSDDNIPPAAFNYAFDAELAAATERMDINEEDEVNNYQAEELNNTGKCDEHEDLAEDSVSGAETESFVTAAEEMETSSDTFASASESEVTSSFRPDRQDNDNQSPFNSNVASSSFTFSASSFSGVQGQQSTSKRISRKKYPVPLGQDPYILIPNASSFKSSQHSPVTGVQSHLSMGKPSERDPFTRLQKPINNPVMDKARDENDASTAAQEACEKWRLRGNNAYKNGDLSKAEESYKQGIDSVPKVETSRNCLRALMLCYSNRAATRMALGRMRDAIADCTMASSIDSNFLKVQVRAGNCYLSLGEIEDASRYFKKCLQSGSDICVDRKIIVEASEGLQKAQRVSECMHEARCRLQLKTSTDVEKALEILEEALLISPYSENLLTMKGEALMMLEKYEASIKLCEQTIDLAGKNSLPIDANKYPDSDDTPKDINFGIWRCRLMLKSYFHMGKLEEAINSLEKQEQLLSAIKRDGNKPLESFIPLAATIRELLRLKSAGNEAFKSGRHTEAVEHYTAALSCNVESRSFTAVCFCNRSAAYKALGQLSDAIADCSLAIALDQNYSKAISRRATLFEMLRDYGQAASDMHRYVNILTKQMEDRTSGDRFTNMANDIRQARMRLSELEEKSRKETSLDMYLVLGVVQSCSASDIRKAYRKAALKHHPDKAGQSLTRNESKDERLWKEIGEEVRRDTDKLFKMIGEAYAVLSDPAKRSQYDLEEEMQNSQRRRDGASTSGAEPDGNYPFSNSRRNWREGWSSRREPSAPRWFEQNRSNRYPL
ncbi:Heat shock protein DnaJ with tetratricopeptide repeat-containing protein [Hirschfeldia incana]|nr:Heat shock protein DnaJ with tetratricopeptide repeat-containing protein [Hirschfeldia incana]